MPLFLNEAYIQLQWQSWEKRNYQKDFMTFFKFIISNVSFQILKWFLQRLEKAVASFTDSVRPVCLAVPDFIDYPPCPDVSLVVVLLLSNKIMGFGQTFKPSR